MSRCCGDCPLSALCGRSGCVLALARPSCFGLRARRSEGGGRPCGPTALRSSGRGRAVHLAPRASRAAHDAGESDHEARCARRPRPCGPRRLPRPAAPAPQAALLQGRGVPSAAPSPRPSPAGGRGRQALGPSECIARACLQRCGQAGRGARGRRRAWVLRGAACTQCTLRELTRRRRAQRATRAELSGRRAPRSAQARGVGPQGRPPPSRVAAGLPAPLSRQCKHVCFEMARPTATGRRRQSHPSGPPPRSATPAGMKRPHQGPCAVRATAGPQRGGRPS